MKNIDMRFDQNIIKDFIGKTFIKYRCDEFIFTNSVTQIVGFYIDNEIYKLTNIEESVDYFGTLEDTAVFRIEKAQEEDIRSAFSEGKQIDNPVQAPIDEIILVNENQTVEEYGTKTYDVWLTRGIIFKVDGREISFEKENWPFSEEINILKGYNLADQYSSTDAFSEEWGEGITAVATREYVSIK